MRHDALKVFLERRRDGDDRQALGDRVQHLEIVAHHHVGFAGEQKLQAVDLRAAHLDGDVEAGLLVNPGGLGLIEAAVLGLRVPTGQKGDLVRSVRGAGDERQRPRLRQDLRMRKRDMVVSSGWCCDEAATFSGAGLAPSLS